MAECPSCGAALRDGAKICPSCGSVLARPPESGAIRPDSDTRRFVVAGTAEDPLATEELVGVIEEAGIPVMARARRRGVVEPITTAALQGWWEILVPDEFAERAGKLIEQERARLEAQAEENARAAEEEEAETEVKS